MEPPRPLAGLPPVDARAVARAWLVRRIAGAPLEAAVGLASGAFAEQAPALCGSLVAALGDDAALAALPRAATPLATLAGDEPGEVVAVTEHLRRAVLDELVPDAALLAPLHDRLAHACSALLGAALAPGGVAPDEGMAATSHHAGAAPAGAERGRPDSVPAGAGPPWAPITARDARRPDARQLAGFDDHVARDPRAQLTAEAERLVVASVPFALLAVEVEDAAVVPASVLAAAEAALHAALPPGAVQTPDGPGSLLVLAREADGRALARTLTQAVGGAASHHGAPLRAAAGVAQHPRDGDTPEALLAHADGQLFAARAEGLPLA